MTTIVWGHGARSRGDETTFVPEGTTVKWFADLDENLLTRNGFLALSSGDFGSPRDSQGPGRGTEVPIFNYEVSEDLVKRDRVAILHRGDSDLKFVGAEVAEGPLCTDVAGCRAAGGHRCRGLLGTVSDTEIVILVCRGLPGGDTGTAAFGTDAVTSDIDADFKEWFDRWLAQVRTDPDAAMAAFEEFSTPVKLQVGTYLAVPAWQAVHWAAAYAREGDVPSLFAQFRDEGQNETLPWFFTNITQYHDAFGTCAAANPTEFFTALAGAPPLVREGIGKIPQVAAAKAGAQQERFETGATATAWVPTESDLAGLAGPNKQAIKDAGTGDSVPYVVGGFATLVGTYHDQAWYDWIYSLPDHAQGEIKVRRATFGAGSLEVSGCPAAKQEIVKAALEAFSDKDVAFV